MKNKKGSFEKWKVITAGAIGVLAIIALIVILYVVSNSVPKAKEASNVLTNSFSIAQGLDSMIKQKGTGTVGSAVSFIGYIIFGILKYGVGVSFDAGGQLLLSDSLIIIQISVFFIFFLVLNDMISAFGMMESTWTPKLVAFFVTLVMANLGAFSYILGALMSVFAFLAGFAVIAVLGVIIFFAVAAHFGLTQFAERMMNRKAMMEAAKMKAGGEELAGTIAGMKKVGAALKKPAE